MERARKKEEKKKLGEKVMAITTRITIHYLLCTRKFGMAGRIERDYQLTYGDGRENKCEAWLQCSKAGLWGWT